jgi:hypothetical protein
MVLTVSTVAGVSVAHTFGGAHDRVSRAQAISAAGPNVFGDGARLIAVRAGRFDAFWSPGETDFARPREYPVWAVVYGPVTVSLSCGPAPTPGTPPRACPPPQRTTELVIIDARTGAFVEADFPAPGFPELP